MSSLHEAMTMGENVVFSMMQHILENDYDGIHKDNAKYFCKKVAESFEDDLDEDMKEYFLSGD